MESMEEKFIITSARLRAIRKEQKMTQREFADKFGISQSSYSAYESGTTLPTLLFLMQIAVEYNISLDYLAGLSENKKGLQADEDEQYITQNFLKPIYEKGYSEEEVNRIAIQELAKAVAELQRQQQKNTPDK